MSRSRTDMHRLQELVRLCRMGRSARDVARLLRMGRNIVRAYREAIGGAGLLGGGSGRPSGNVGASGRGRSRAELASAPPPQQTSTLEKWADEIRAMLAKDATPVDPPAGLVGMQRASGPNRSDDRLVLEVGEGGKLMPAGVEALRVPCSQPSLEIGFASRNHRGRGIANSLGNI